MLILTVILFSLYISSNAQHLKTKASKIYVGTALAPQDLSDTVFSKILAEEFNCLTPENAMKWAPIEQTRDHPDYSKGDKVVAFAKQHNMKVRGHTLVWHREVPLWAQRLSKAEFEKAMKKHITDVVTHFKGQIYAWDVHNEILNDDGSMRDSVWHKNMGSSYVAEALRTAHAADPNAKLYINDYGIESVNKKSDALIKLVKSLKAEGVPIHGIGIQAHMMVGQMSKTLGENIKRFAAAGVDVAITELDVRIHLPSNQANFQQQAKDYATAFSDCEAEPRCVGVTVWGFTDKYSGKSFAAGYGDKCLWDHNLKPKPAVSAVEKVLK